MELSSSRAPLGAGEARLSTLIYYYLLLTIINNLLLLAGGVSAAFVTLCDHSFSSPGLDSSCLFLAGKAESHFGFSLLMLLRRK